MHSRQTSHSANAQPYIRLFIWGALLLCLSHLVGCDYGLITISDKNMVTIRFEVPEDFPGVPYVSSHWSSDSFLCRNISFTTGDRDAPAKFGKSVSAEKIDGSWVVTFPTELEHPLCSWSLDMNTIGIDFANSDRHLQLAWLYLKDGVSANGWDTDMIVCDQNNLVFVHESTGTIDEDERLECKRADGKNSSGFSMPATLFYIGQKNNTLRIKFSGNERRSYNLVLEDSSFNKKTLLTNGTVVHIVTTLVDKKHWEVFLSPNSRYNILYYEGYGVPPVLNSTLPLSAEQLKILSADDQWELPDFITGK